MPKKKWVIESGEGHWEVTYGQTTVTCDDAELSETISELLTSDI